MIESPGAQPGSFHDIPWRPARAGPANGPLELVDVASDRPRSATPPTLEWQETDWLVARFPDCHFDVAPHGSHNLRELGAKKGAS
jgi:hypothetical protein